jgi:3-deoxy-D-manno-octulosonic-acid transferase
VSVAWLGYRLLAPLAGAAAPLLRGWAPGPERALWPERLGEVAAGPADAWLHAASMGESMAVQGLLETLRAHAPGARLRLTATTRTGRARLLALGEPATLAPLDTPQAVARFFERVRPRRLLLLETELWPQWLLGARDAGVPVAVLSARLSSRSLAGYRWLGDDFARLVAELAAVLCQSDLDRERWIALGANPARTLTVGNLKNDGLPEPAKDRGAARAELGFDPERPLLVLGSLRPGEAAPLAAAWRGLPEALRRGWQVVAVPRHAHASESLRREAAASGVTVMDSGAPRDGAWRWDARAGVLRGYYAAGEVAFVGGTLGPYGGHHPLEPAACGAAVLTGPHLEAQRPAVQALEAAGGITIARDAEGLAVELRGLLEDDARRAGRAAAALAAAGAAKGATRRAVERLVEWGLWPA